MNETALTTIVTGGPLDVAISGWLDSIFHKSQSERTLTEYARTMQRFRAGLHREDLDLDADPARLAFYIQAFCGFSARGKPISGATYNQRLGIISSWFEYARKRDIVLVNPVERIDRAKVQEYASAMPLGQEQVSARLAAIDRSTPEGKRNYALVVCLLECGWRANEIGQLTWGDVQLSNSRATLVCPRAKGGEVIANQFSKAATACLLEWLHAYYGAEIGSLAFDKPLWPVLAPGGRAGKNHGQRLSYQAISDIIRKTLGSSRVHITRHTSARLMEESGMPISEIMQRLNHKSLQTTSVYLARLRRAENAYSDKIASMLGLGIE